MIFKYCQAIVPIPGLKSSKVRAPIEAGADTETIGDWALMLCSYEKELRVKNLI